MHRRLSFLVHLWVEPREIAEVKPAFRGRASAIESERSIAFDSMTNLERFMIDELETPNVRPTNASGDTGGGAR